MARPSFAHSDAVGTLFEGAMGLPWLIPGTGQPYLNNTEITSYLMDILRFSFGNLTIEVLDDNTVLFTYKFQDFQGETAVPSELEAPVSWVTHC